MGTKISHDLTMSDDYLMDFLHVMIRALVAMSRLDRLNYWLKPILLEQEED